MADIFISYSRKDSKQALALAEKLRTEGMSVWIDQHGIEAATSWSKEIVQAIWNCKAFIILLSESSLASDNVVKELSIASEKRKPIVPLELHALELTEDFTYQLSGIQRVSLNDQDAILRALKKLGIESVLGVRKDPPHPVSAGRSFNAHPLRPQSKRALLFGIPILLIVLAVTSYFLFFDKKPAAAGTLKRLAVLPFESLSTDKENDYFADGMTATLIDMLVPVPELRVVDRKSSMQFKGEKKDLKSIASALNVRYIVDGTIQRQGNAIHIAVQMTDAETGKVLMSKTFDGTLTDHIAIQQQIAKSIVIYLQLTFNPGMVSVPPDAATSSSEAYDLCLLAASSNVYNNYDSTRVLYLRAASLDTAFAFPYLALVLSYCNDYKSEPTPRKLVLADSFFVIGKRLDTAQIYSHFVASFLATTHKDFERAIDEANTYLAKRPEDCRGYRALALAYEGMGRHAMSADQWIEDLKRNPLASTDMYALLLSLLNARDTLRLAKYSAEAIPLFTASIGRNPDRRTRFYYLPLALVLGGRVDEASSQLDEMLKEPGTGGSSYWWAAGMNALGHKQAKAMELLKKSITMDGLREIDLEWSFIDNIRSLPEFQALVKQKAELLKADSAKKNG